jgi:hypothetical protein
MNAFSNMFTIVHESSDGKPLTTSIGDLFWDFPLNRLTVLTNNPLVGWTMWSEVVLGLILFYWVSKRPLKELNFDSKSSKVFTYAVAIVFYICRYVSVGVGYWHIRRKDLDRDLERWRWFHNRNRDQTSSPRISQSSTATRLLATNHSVWHQLD